MVKLWFEVKNVKEGIKIAMKIYRLKEFTDSCVMIETPKKAIAVVNSPRKVTKRVIQEIDKKKFKNRRKG